ncbi:suppressor of deletion of TFIIS [Gurleya vavrai]
MTKTPFLIPIKESSIDKFAEHIKKSNSALVFDIDDTLYCQSSGLSAYIRDKIYAYAEKKNIPKENIQTICKEYSHKYGLSLKGFLKEVPGTDPIEFDNLVDNCVDLQSFIKKDIKLIEMLKCFDMPKYCFTNANFKHAVKVLEVLDIYNQFDAIFYCEYAKSGDFLCKPEEKAFDVVRTILGTETIIYFFDDNNANIQVAHDLGWNSYFINFNYNIKQALQDLIRKNGTIMLNDDGKRYFKMEIEEYCEIVNLINMDDKTSNKNKFDLFNDDIKKMGLFKDDLIEEKDKNDENCD